MIRRLAGAIRAGRAYLNTPAGQVLIASFALKVGMDSLINVVRGLQEEVQALSGQVAHHRAYILGVPPISEPEREREQEYPTREDVNPLHHSNTEE